MQLAFLLFLIAIVGSMWGRGRFLKVYGQESGNTISSGITGGEIADRILRHRGVRGVSIVRGRGVIEDAYEPERRQITLAPQHLSGSTFSALAIAALQAGKAIQHHEGHHPLLWRIAAVRWSVYLSLPLLLAGIPLFLLGMGKTMLPLLVLAWSLLAFWNFLTVPTEIDAVLRAKRELGEMRLFRNLDERVGVERVMGAASTANIDGLSVFASWIGRTFLPWIKAKVG